MADFQNAKELWIGKYVWIRLSIADGSGSTDVMLPYQVDFVDVRVGSVDLRSLCGNHFVALPFAHVFDRVSNTGQKIYQVNGTVETPDPARLTKTKLCQMILTEHEQNNQYPISDACVSESSTVAVAMEYLDRIKHDQYKLAAAARAGVGFIQFKCVPDKYKTFPSFRSILNSLPD